MENRADLNQSMDQFRLASRELYNRYFRLAEPYPTSDLGWSLLERFREVESVLFAALVSGCGVELNGYRSVQPHIVVKLRRVHEIPAMINREIDSGYFDFKVKHITSEATCHFIEFFDFDVLGVRDNQYVRAVIHAWSAHQETVGKHVLLEANLVIFGDAK